MQIGIVGLPNAGKTTLFNALTNNNAAAENYPFTTIEPNLGRVTLADTQLPQLQRIFNAAKWTPIFVEFVDIAGLVKDAHKGEGLGNKFLDHIRKVDALVLVLRSFNDVNVAHVQGKIAPLADLETVEMELIYADLGTLEKRIKKTESLCKTGEKRYTEELAFYKRVETFLNQSQPLWLMELTEDEQVLLNELHLLSIKPTLYLVNGDDEEGCISREIKNMRPGNPNVMVLDAQLEYELTLLSPEEAKEFMADLGQEPLIQRFVDRGFSLLDLLRFYTGNKNEVRAWHIKKGAILVEAAGKVHTDMARGFIKGEVVQASRLLAIGSWHKAKETGELRIEGRNYQVKNDDVIYIHFR